MDLWQVTRSHNGVGETPEVATLHLSGCRDGVDDLHLTGFAGVASRDVTLREQNMQEVAVVGLDLAKNVFQVHGVAANGGCPSSEHSGQAGCLFRGELASSGVDI